MRLKKIILILIPFLLAAVIIGYTPKSTETSAYNVKKKNLILTNIWRKIMLKLIWIPEMDLTFLKMILRKAMLL